MNTTNQPIPITILDEAKTNAKVLLDIGYSQIREEKKRLKGKGIAPNNSPMYMELALQFRLQLQLTQQIFHDKNYFDYEI